MAGCIHGTLNSRSYNAWPITWLSDMCVIFSNGVTEQLQVDVTSKLTISRNRQLRGDGLPHAKKLQVRYQSCYHHHLPLKFDTMRILNLHPLMQSCSIQGLLGRQLQPSPRQLHKIPETPRSICLALGKPCLCYC